MLSKDVPEIEKATDILEVMSKNEKQRMVYEAREAYLHDMATYLEEAEKKLNIMKRQNSRKSRIKVVPKS